MKKIISSFLTFLFVFISSIPAFAGNSYDYRLTSEVAELNFSIDNDMSTLSLFNLYDENTHVQSYNDYAVITSNNSIISNFDLSDNLHFEKMSNLPTEEDVILIKNQENQLQGVIGIPRITLSTGEIIHGNNTISGNRIISEIPENISSDVESISLYVYVQREFSYYFSSGGYSYRPYSELNGALGGNFYLNPIAYNFQSDKARQLEVLAMSWHAVDTYFKSSALSSGDRATWINYNDNLKKQYECHYDWASLGTQWNLEDWRPDASYAVIVAHGCNYY